MKKSTILFMGILLGSIFISPHLFSHSYLLLDEDPAGVEQAISEVKVFPNPSDGRFKLTFEYAGNENVKAKVFDITGKQVKDISEDLVKSERSVTASVDLESPSSGIYFIRIEYGKSILTKKIIVR
ncbi:MAG: hypothetical protein DRI97_02845 [Bacteroidetes bacterium]|nr:MAG: hypothetical protein DRI97_02845 [Bacteroidota bacterium]RLD95164.1 MAG: hypothetical protein DRJ29_03725 [Bacteroidota bacterium]